MKTKENILEQTYVSPSDLKVLIPTLGIDQCRRFIDDVRLEMENKHYFVPQSIPRLALTKLVIKKLGL